MADLLTDTDLEALRESYARNPSLLFSAQVVRCLQELQWYRSEFKLDDSQSDAG